ncbi:hypothetical protein OROGR_021024 [Orobanche gracilis]
MATLKNLKTKTDTCKRIQNDLDSYEKEVEREAAKTADMKDKEADPYDLKQQENVLAESRMMIPDTRQRLEKALNDLNDILENVLAESRMMIPDTRQRFEKALNDLIDILTQLKESGEKEEGSEFDDARSVVESLEQLFPPSQVQLVTSVVNDGCS